MFTSDLYRTTTSPSFTKVREICSRAFKLHHNVCVRTYVSHLPLPSSSHTSRCPCAARHRHSLPTVLAHAGRQRGEHAPSHCGEPHQDHGCVSGRVSGLLSTRHGHMIVVTLRLTFWPPTGSTCAVCHIDDKYWPKCRIAEMHLVKQNQSTS